MIDEGVPDCLILASGLSRRLGYDKATIQLGETTLLSAMIETMKDHGMKTCVVIGPTSDEAGSSDSVIFVRNENPDHGRTGSIQVGLEALGWPERVIVAPVDRPGFSSRTLRGFFLPIRVPAQRNRAEGAIRFFWTMRESWPSGMLIQTHR